MFEFSPQSDSGVASGIAHERAFSDVYRQHSKAVYSVAARVGGAGRADDVTQDVFLRLWRGVLVFDPTRGSLRTFLLTVTRNLSLDQVRSNTNRQAREARDARREPRGAETGPEALAVASERTRQVVDALTQLSSERREAIVMAFFGGLSYCEVATALGEAEGTVKSRIRAGLQQLRPLIS